MSLVQVTLELPEFLVDAIDIDKKKRLKKFFALCGKVELDSDEVENLRNKSMI